MLQEFDDDPVEVDSFFSDDGAHLVEWKFSKELGYETWICTTHDKPYYRDCVKDGGVYVVVTQ